MNKVSKKTISLKYPIPMKIEKEGKLIAEDEITSITLGRIKAKHLKLMPEGFFKVKEGEETEILPHEAIPLIAGMANMSVDMVEEIDLEDMIEICGALGDFLSMSLPTGKS